MFKAIRKDGKIIGFTAKESDLWRADDKLTGICMNCGKKEDGRCEPDAVGYKCSHCGEMKLCSPTELALRGKIRIEG